MSDDGITAKRLLEAALDVRTRFPHARLVKNAVGNLAIMNEGGTYIGYMDLRTGDVELTELPDAAARSNP